MKEDRMNIYEHVSTQGGKKFPCYFQCCIKASRGGSAFNILDGGFGICSIVLICFITVMGKNMRKEEMTLREFT